MRSYDFGDVYDCRKAPGLDHFIIVVGVQNIGDKTYILFEKVTSRVYKAFKKLSDFFENNCHGQCNTFKHNFKSDDHIYHYGKLCNTLFLDKDENFALTEDSMIVIKGDPHKTEVEVLENLIKAKMAVSKVRISDGDIYKLEAIIKNSGNIISDAVALAMRQSFNRIDKEIRILKHQKTVVKKS